MLKEACQCGGILEPVFEVNSPALFKRKVTQYIVAQCIFCKTTTKIVRVWESNDNKETTFTRQTYK